MPKQKAAREFDDKDVKRRKPDGENGAPSEGEESLDQTIEDSFPASDPPSSIPNPDGEEAA